MNSNMHRAFAHRRGRAARTNFELYAWFFLRLSGVVLLGIALFHMYYMHFVLGVDNIDFEAVAGRWGNPLWRIFDFFLLLFSLTHGMVGLRYLLDDYIGRPGWRVFAKSLAFLVYVVVLGAGAYIILTFAPDMYQTGQP